MATVRYDVDEMTVKFLAKQDSYNAVFSNNNFMQHTLSHYHARRAFDNYTLSTFQ